MLEGAKLIGAGAATIALAGAAIGIGNVFSSLIHSVARNPSLAKPLFGYAIFGFALTEAIALFALMMGFFPTMGLFVNFNFSSVFSIPPGFYGFFGRLAFIYTLGFVINKMENESPTRSEITINSNMSGGQPKNNRRKKETAQKSARRHLTRWMVAYATGYDINIEGFSFHDWMETADLILQQEFDYRDPQKTLSELKSLARFISQESKKECPADPRDHPLQEVFDDHFPPDA